MEKMELELKNQNLWEQLVRKHYNQSSTQNPRAQTQREREREITAKKV